MPLHIDGSEHRRLNHDLWHDLIVILEFPDPPCRSAKICRFGRRYTTGRWTC
jgi:hypothetical protein